MDDGPGVRGRKILLDPDLLFAANARIILRQVKTCLVLPGRSGRVSLSYGFARRNGSAGRNGRGDRRCCGNAGRGRSCRHAAVRLPVRGDELARIFRGVADCMRCTRPQDVSGAVRNFNLAVAAQKAPVLLRLPVEQDRVIRIRLIERDDNAGAVFLQVFCDLHALIMGVDG